MSAQSVRVNVVANFVGQFWAGVISVAFIPLYVRYIGIEGYGIVGFFAMMQALYSLLDMGMSATLGREMAIGSATDSPLMMPVLLRTIEFIYLPFGFLIALVTWGLSDWVAEYWLQTGSIGVREAAFAITLLGFSAALQWPSSLYVAGLTGLQHQVLLNGIRVVFSTISACGCVAVLMRWPSLSTYLGWQIASSALQSIIFAWAMYRVLPRGGQAKFSMVELRRIRGFAGGVMGITFVSLLLTQADRFILSRALPLDQFGYYALASSLAAVVYRVVQPLYLAYAPRYAQLAAQLDSGELARQYHLSNQMMALILGPILALSFFWGHDIIFLWSRDAKLTAEVAPIFSVLVVAWSLHGLMTLPYALQLAYGWTRLSLIINLGSLFFVLPVFWFLGQMYGGIGVASGWLLLTTIYIALGPPLTHRRLLRGEAVRWYLHDIAPVLLASFVVAAFLAWCFSPLSSGILGWMQLIAVSAIVFLSGLIAARQLLPMARAMLGRIF